MDYILKKYCPRIEFDSYEDFYENFKINVPEDFNFGYDVVDEWARVEPEKRALLWCNDAGEERRFTFTDISRLSNKTANAFKKLGKGEVSEDEIKTLEDELAELEKRLSRRGTS